MKATTLNHVVFPFQVAAMYHTYNVPYINDEPRKVWQLIREKFKPLKSKVIGILIAQMLLASVVTYFEVDSVFRVHRALSILEKLEYEE